MLLTAVGLGFAVLNGANDGGALVAASLKAPGIRPLTAIGVLAAALGVVPVVLGVRVAETLAGGLVPAPPEAQRALMVIAVLAALAVVGALNAKGLPTSLTLALVGGLVGAGLGSGLSVSWPLVVLTALAGITAPVVGGLLGLVLSRGPFLPRRESSEMRLRGVHTATFGLQAVAYAANDGQKIYAVIAVGVLATAPGVGVPAWQLVAVPLLFALGAALGVRRATQALGGAGVLRTQPRDEIAGEVSSSLAVLAAAAVGIPVSMTQAIAGSLIGAGMTRGTRRVRWRAAARLAMAWGLTLPSSALLGAGLAGAGGVLR